MARNKNHMVRSLHAETFGQPAKRPGGFGLCLEVQPMHRVDEFPRSAESRQCRRQSCARAMRVHDRRVYPVEVTTKLQRQGRGVTARIERQTDHGCAKACGMVGQETTRVRYDCQIIIMLYESRRQTDYIGRTAASCPVPDKLNNVGQIAISLETSGVLRPWCAVRSGISGTKGRQKDTYSISISSTCTFA
nr:hypothetical protein [uncultured Rhodopila sp.]